MRKKHQAFKESYGGLVDRLPTTVSVSSSLENTKKKDFSAIWDTGAQLTAVSPDVVKALNLVPVDSWEVYGVNGKVLLPVVIVDIMLPNKYKMQKVYAAVAAIGGGDVLLGMNAITLGDFLITNKNKQTELSFTVPPLEERLDLYKIATEINHQQT